MADVSVALDTVATIAVRRAETAEGQAATVRAVSPAERTSDMTTDGWVEKQKLGGPRGGG